jgi:hypothetical protein
MNGRRIGAIVFAGVVVCALGGGLVGHEISGSPAGAQDASPTEISCQNLSAITQAALGESPASAESSIEAYFETAYPSITPTFTVNDVSNSTQPATLDDLVEAWSPGPDFPNSPIMLNVQTGGFTGSFQSGGTSTNGGGPGGTGSTGAPSFSTQPICSH